MTMEIKDPHHREQHECEHTITRLDRGDTRAWASSVTHVKCLTSSIGCSGLDEDTAEDCGKLIRRRDKGVRRSWIAGMVPVECVPSFAFTFREIDVLIRERRRRPHGREKGKDVERGEKPSHDDKK